MHSKFDLQEWNMCTIMFAKNVTSLAHCIRLPCSQRSIHVYTLIVFIAATIYIYIYIYYYYYYWNEILHNYLHHIYHLCTRSCCWCPCITRDRWRTDPIFIYKRRHVVPTPNARFTDLWSLMERSCKLRNWRRPYCGMHAFESLRRLTWYIIWILSKKICVSTSARSTADERMPTGINNNRRHRDNVKADDPRGWRSTAS